MQAPYSETVQYRPPRVDIYTILLAIALVAVIIGCVFLFLEVQDYGSPPYPEGGVAKTGVQQMLEMSPSASATGSATPAENGVLSIA